MKEGVIKMVLYLHKHYKGSFSLDVWCESLGQFEVLPYYGNIDGSMEVATIYKLAKNLGASKLVLDF